MPFEISIESLNLLELELQFLSGCLFVVIMNVSDHIRFKAFHHIDHFKKNIFWYI